MNLFFIFIRILSPLNGGGRREKAKSQPSNKPPEDQRISWMRRKEIGVCGREGICILYYFKKVELLKGQKKVFILKTEVNR